MYKHWKGPVYPQDISSDAMLKEYTKIFDTVEVNNTFYQLPSIDKVKTWKESTPDNFLFIIKANRYITHMKNLLDPEEPVNNLLERIKILGDKLGPILFQLPPQWGVNAERLENFVNYLPKNYRYAFELRDESWYTKEIYDILEKNNLAFCIHDHCEAPSPEKVTADFVYARFHGPHGDYRSKYSKDELKLWEGKIKDWQNNGLDVFCYFNNDMKGYAVENAKELLNLTS